MDNNIINNNTDESKPKNEPEKSPKASRWIGIVALILFFIFDGFDLCSSFMWVIFAALVLLTVGGTYKWGQAVLGVILLIFSTSIFGAEESGYNSSESRYEATSNSSGDQQSESERKAIEREIAEIESLHAQFERAYDRGFHTEAKRLSDLAMSKYRALQQKNLTRAQRARLSKLFSI